MNIVHKKPEVYAIQKLENHRHCIIKILKQYDDEQDAVKDMAKLLTGEITEQELGMKEE